VSRSQREATTRRNVLTICRLSPAESQIVLGQRSLPRHLELYFKVDSERCGGIGGQPIPDSGFQIADWRMQNGRFCLRFSLSRREAADDQARCARVTSHAICD
jgi:hypothetical protein